ncbi:hypothetical protein KXW98_008759 [Aspergillus fumigatus]|uniref:Uncharacterized protein n=1 Tax=Aspergillus fumigatus TaxID=746128 RepID=A0A229Y226_ASPFM|nr:hypothetical protein KXX45_007256 [Aspergillus fumigatus]KMK59905.1 hypothetical protein Y699_01106 [Aspergillus fumigatus Z5]KAH1287302.1 hypothetical protein KXX30_008525 [Aspergillus fumigatus]KAH1292242.1 hypothetical protein KXX11_009696 [Aspergillus fumigatus]KAH1314819.1 hypothetical protein KXX66_007016 [Aspergillus fumigatus]
MKLSSAFIIGFLPLALARSILVTYPQDTPDSVIKDAQKSIVEGGGHITHEYQFIKGFSAEAPDTAIQSLSTQSTKYKPIIEGDQVVSTYGDKDCNSS